MSKYLLKPKLSVPIKFHDPPGRNSEMLEAYRLEITGRLTVFGVQGLGLSNPYGSKYPILGKSGPLRKDMIVCLNPGNRVVIWLPGWRLYCKSTDGNVITLPTLSFSSRVNPELGGDVAKPSTLNPET